MSFLFINLEKIFEDLSFGLGRFIGFSGGAPEENQTKYSRFENLSNRRRIDRARPPLQLHDGMLDGAAVVERALESDLLEDPAEVALRLKSRRIGDLRDGE